MSESDVDELGPVDYLVIEFPAGHTNFTGEMASELAALVSAGIVRVLDILILTKDANGDIEAFEIDDFEAFDELRAIETEIARAAGRGRHRPPRRGHGAGQHRRGSR